MTESSSQFDQPPEDYLTVESFLHEASLNANVSLDLLTVAHLNESFPRIASSLPAWLTTQEVFTTLKDCAVKRLQAKIELGIQSSMPSEKTILHTAPHHVSFLVFHSYCVNLLFV